MPTTPVYGFPYPSLNDPPNSPAQIQALAEAVESRVQANDQAVRADTFALVDGRNLRSLGGRVVAQAGIIHNDVAGTEVNVTKLAFENTAVTQGRVYELNVVLRGEPSAADNSFVVRVRKDTALSGTVVAEWTWITKVAGFTDTGCFSLPWVATATDADADFYVSLLRIAGAGTFDLRGDRLSAFWIDEVLLENTSWVEVA